MDINIKLEPIEIQSDNEINTNLKIKEEAELLIESEDKWMPMKFEDEENEYYQEFAEECSHNEFPQTVIKNENFCEQYTIIEQNEDYDDDDYGSDEYAEMVDYDTNMKNDSEVEVTEFNLDLEDYTKSQIEELEKQEDLDIKESADSKVLCKLELNRWLNNNYIKRECPACNEVLINNEWRRHIELNHKESIEEAESNYFFSNDNCGVCCKCNQEIVARFPRYVHSIKHSEAAAKLEKSICKICDFNSLKYFIVQKHILEEHSEVVKNFRISETNLKCPLCPNIYRKYIHLSYHFMDKHPQEYKAKFCFNCHLCDNERFSEEQFFLQHLIEKHELNSWKILKYRKPFEDKEYIVCTTCNRLFFDNDTANLLKHFLKHENCYYWFCRFCCKKTYFKKSVGHMCVQMVRFYEKVKIDNLPNDTDKKVWKINNLQEFEEYIAHVCPFCNAEFTKMLKWQHHLRTVHKIDTLKGLEMKVVVNDNNKLCCVICHTIVPNYPEQLHAHRFQHLPYKPYKCLHCLITLNTFKMAVNHVLKRCNDEIDRDYIKSILAGKIDGSSNDIRSMLEIQCSYCKSNKFKDIRTVLKHFENDHNNFEEFFLKHPDNSITCKICNNQYVHYETNTFFEHLHHHFDEKTFKCLLCLQSYHKFKGCYQHLLNTHYVKPLNHQSKEENIYKTSFFLNNEDKVTHVTNLPQLAKPTRKSHVLNEYAEFITYACPECNEGMTTQAKWHTHITTQHDFFKESNLYIKDADGSLKCPTCKMTMVTSITQQQKHKLTHMPHKSFICNLCYIRCNSLGVLYGHFRRKHFAQGSFQCPICSEILQTAHQRTEHLKKTHPRDEWPASMCLICYKILTTKSSLNSHMATHDADRFRYSCDICGCKIIELKDFNFHMDRHIKRGEVKLQENIVDDFTSQSGSKFSQSKETKYSEKYDHAPKCKNDFNFHTDRHQNKGKVKLEENIADDFTSQSGSKFSHSNDTDVEQTKYSEKYNRVPKCKIDFNFHADRHQNKGEVKLEENMVDDFTVQSGSKFSQSNITGVRQTKYLVKYDNVPKCKKDFNFHMNRHQNKGEVKLEENIVDDFASQSGSKFSQSNDTDVGQTKYLEKYDNDPKCKKEILNKRKSLTKSSVTKKKKNNTK